MKTEIKLSDKAIKFYCDWNSITLEDVSEIDRYEIKCMEQYANKVSRESKEAEAINFLDWVAKMDYPVLIGGKTKPDIDYYKYKTWDDLYKDFIRRKSKQEQP